MKRPQFIKIIWLAWLWHLILPLYLAQFPLLELLLAIIARMIKRCNMYIHLFT